MRRNFIKGLFVASTLLGTALTGTSFAQERESISIGYAISKTGANAAGANITTISTYQLWFHEIEQAGGLLLPDGSRLPVDITEYDDRSSVEDLVRAIERLATQDEVDFILPPWGTGFHLAVAPLFDRFGYPLLAVTANTDRGPELSERWPNAFFLNQGGSDFAASLGEVLSAARDAGQINGDVAMISIADGFGIDLANGARATFPDAGLNIVYDISYPPGTTDFTPMLNEAAASGADSFVAFSYPPGTFALTQQAQIASYNPATLYLGIGVAFPAYLGANGANTEGVMSLGGLNQANQAVLDFMQRHEEVTGNKADSYASIITYVSLQMLEQAIARAGLDRAAVMEELATGSFDTIFGEITLENKRLPDLWKVGQWQDGVFVAIAPVDREGATAPVIPKPEWAE